ETDEVALPGAFAFLWDGSDVDWYMRGDQFPMNSVEVSLLVNLFTILIYVAVSLLTCRKPFNMARMLHRGKYADPNEKVFVKIPWTWRTLPEKLVGITGEYTRGDRILAWSVFVWSFGCGFLICFALVLLWNHVSPWSVADWSLFFWIKTFLAAILIGVVSTVWFTWGGIRDLRQLFQDLKSAKRNVLDDGRVCGNVSLADAQAISEAEQKQADEGSADDGMQA
ncbi:MAG: hypothetical protein ACI4QT_10715, partial [Kiritimatiellia bacterium]